MPADTFICGNCSATSYSIQDFLTHKQSCQDPPPPDDVILELPQKEANNIKIERDSAIGGDSQINTDSNQSQEVMQIATDANQSQGVIQITPDSEVVDLKEEIQDGTVAIIMNDNGEVVRYVTASEMKEITGQTSDPSQLIVSDNTALDTAVTNAIVNSIAVDSNEQETFGANEPATSSSLQFLPNSDGSSVDVKSFNFNTTVSQQYANIPTMAAQPRAYTGKKRGRPKKSEQAAKQTSETEKIESKPVAETDESGKLVCTRCKKKFNRERHFSTHRCIANTEYLDICKDLDDEIGRDEVVVDDDATDDYKLPYIYQYQEKKKQLGNVQPKKKTPENRTLLKNETLIKKGPQPIQMLMNISGTTAIGDDAGSMALTATITPITLVKEETGEVVSSGGGNVGLPIISNEGTVQLAIANNEGNILPSQTDSGVINTGIADDKVLTAVANTGILNDISMAETNKVPGSSQIYIQPQIKAVGVEPHIVTPTSGPNSRNWVKIDNLKLPETLREIPDKPIFTNEKDKLEFDEAINSVDLSVVDSMLAPHSIVQDTKPGADAGAPSRSGELTVFSCSMCEKVSMTLSHARYHCLTHTDLKPFKCPKCDYRNNTKGNLYTHMRTHTGQYYTCDYCHFKSIIKSHLFEHLEVHIGEKRQCQLCKKQYSTLKSLVIHIKKYHSKSKAGKEYLAQFQNSKKTIATLHQCHICNRKFKKKIERDRHLSQHNIQTDSEIFQCDLCSHTCVRQQTLHKHYLKHRVVYTCTHCGERFPSSIRLNTHLTEHIQRQEGVDQGNLFKKSIACSYYLPEAKDDAWIQKACNDNTTTDENTEPRTISLHLEVGPQNNVLVQSIQDDTNIIYNEQQETQESFISQEEMKAEITSTTDDYNVINDTGATEQRNTVANSLNIIETGQLNEEMHIANEQENPNGQLDNFVGDNVTQSDIANDEHDETDVKLTPCNSQGAPKEDTLLSLGYINMTLDLFLRLRQSFGNEECEFCGKLFFSKCDFEPHYRSHVGDKPFACDLCSYRATTKNNLRTHMEKEHENLRYMCEICNIELSSRAKLWLHQQKHKPQSLQCTKCNEMFPTYKRLKIHLQLSHPEVENQEVQDIVNPATKGRLGRKSHKCPYCPKSFMRASSDLKKHIWMHQGIKPFKCHLCPHACRSKNNLNEHMIKHRTNKPFLCNMCGKEYRSRTALRWHVRSHKDGKMFKCDRCPYEATQRSHLKRHQETHDIVRKYMCDQCDYSSNTIAYMKIHYTRNHKGLQFTPRANMASETSKQNCKVYRCLSCDYLFGNLSDMKRHLKIRHHIQVEDMKALEDMEVQGPQVQEGVSIVRQVQHDDVQVNPEVQVQDTEEMDSTLQNLQYTVSQGGDMNDERTIQIVQQILDISQQNGAFNANANHQVTYHDGGGEPVDPETIIIGPPGEEVVVGDDPSNQFVIKYITAEEAASIENATVIHSSQIQRGYTDVDLQGNMDGMEQELGQVTSVLTTEGNHEVIQMQPEFEQGIEGVPQKVTIVTHQAMDTTPMEQGSSMDHEVSVQESAPHTMDMLNFATQDTQIQTSQFTNIEIVQDNANVNSS